MGAPNSPQSSEMAHREAKTEYLGAYKFFYPRFVWKPAIRPTCHAGKDDQGILIFKLIPPGGFVKKIPPGGNFLAIFHQYFLKKVHFQKCTYCFLKTGGSAEI